MRHAIGEAVGWRCIYCDKPIACIACNPHTSARAVATLDHLNPRSKGGTLSHDNTVLSCPKCNRKKADKIIHLTERQRALQEIGALGRSQKKKEGVQA